LGENLINFLLIFGVQLAFALFNDLPGLPELTTLYGIVVTSLIATLAFYGYNNVKIQKNVTTLTQQTIAQQQLNLAVLSTVPAITVPVPVIFNKTVQTPEYVALLDALNKYQTSIKAV
jgi:cytosine/uracil/thiamine/allantoin permease